MDRAENIRRLKGQANEPKPKKTYTIPKVSKKRQKKLEDQKDLLKLDEDFYKEVWAASAHICQNCDCKLPKTPYNWMFHHVLLKSKRPDLRHIPDNIMILCLECHDQYHRFPDKCPKIKKRAEELEKQFSI
jgi:5-methylcytosine-specific restriction endonuclease McrA